MQLKAQRWSLVEPHVAKIESKLTQLSRFIETEKNVKSPDYESSKYSRALDDSNNIGDQILELEQMVIPLGHSGAVIHKKLFAKHQFQHDFLEELVKSEIDNQELKEAAFRELYTLKTCFDDNFYTIIAEPCKRGLSNL